jgi:hypothetical protein
MTEIALNTRLKAEKPSPSLRAEELSDQRRYNVPAKPTAVPEGLKVLYG